MRKFDETADVHSKRPDVREPWLVISSAAGVRAIPLPRANRVTIGRMHTCDIVIDDESVSRQHAAVIVGPQGLTIEDLGSRNKTRVGGRALGRGETAALPVGAVVEVGYATMFVQVGRPPSARASSPSADPPSIPSTAIVHDPTMQRLYALLDVIAPSPLNVVILGETGTGKEVFAEAMHRGSTRAARPFLKVNCAALSGSLLESELFGHEKGAFTGALGAKPGLFEAADGGTVFLDEVGELPIETQAKLLRVIEYGEVIRLGSVQPRRVDVRYVAATNRDLDHAIAANRFRSDLFFRLNGFSVTLPPLRKRRKDIVPLARHFLDRAACGRPYTVTGESQAALERYAWPGNVRELKNVLERALVLAGAAGRIEPMHLQLPEASSVDSGRDAANGPADTVPPMPYAAGPLHGTWTPGAAMTPPMAAMTPPMGVTAAGAGAPGPPFAPPGSGNDLKAQRESWEKQQILQALEKTSGNQKEAAKVLGVSRRTLINKIEAYGIARPRKR
ncbi:MAG: sigma 54-interacting transcriptional regulator [Labilithrix sp.]|nr:sigma 54-interacting transcriptional regulator [Labilithrix sp.]